MKRLFLTFCIALCILQAFAQTTTGVLTGVVINEKAQPVESSIIRLKGTKYSSTTNFKGAFTINNIPKGKYIVEVTSLGYNPTQSSIEIAQNNASPLTIQLTPTANELAEIVVVGIQSKNGIGNLSETVGPVIYSGKKTEVLVLDSLDANKAQNNPRQILGRIPGMNFSETEGSGFPSNGFGLRGLNPTQSIEMNTRQNSYNITSDIYGYNEAYYNPAMEAVERMEIVRGASSLQFGPQFGGVVNFIMKEAPKDKPFEYIFQQTAGNYNLFNFFNSASGSYKKWDYYAYVQYKNNGGWRPNSGYQSLTGYGKIGYQATDKLKLGLEYSILRNKIQMPGGLTDAAFASDNRQSFRARNWLNSPWNVITGTVNYQLSSNTSMSLKSTYLFSQRNLVWKNEDGGPGEMDSISTETNTYVPREVQREAFSSITNEFRLLSNYTLLGLRNSVAVGIRQFSGKMKRQGGGPGSTNSDFDMHLYGGDYEYALDFTTTNVAPFIENIFRINDRWSITPGFRYEFIHSTAKGYITDDTKVYSDESRNRYIPLLGIGSQYRASATSTLYANWSQAYRPMDYSALTPIGVTSKIDPNLNDSKGYNADLGWRGNVKNFINFDISAFYLKYNKRIGLLSVTDPVTSNVYTLRTNVGNSVSKGLETYIEINPIKAFTDHSRFGNISIFNSFAYINAKYTKGTVDEEGNSLAGNWVEYSPEYINRLGFTYAFKSFSTTFQLSSNAKSYGDANNTVNSEDAVIGLIPAYKVMDVSATYKFHRYNFKAGVNNLGNEQYFTKRTDEYPGPGIIPAIGRSFYISFGAKF